MFLYILKDKNADISLIYQIKTQGVRGGVVGGLPMASSILEPPHYISVSTTDQNKYIYMWTKGTFSWNHFLISPQFHMATPTCRVSTCASLRRQSVLTYTLNDPMCVCAVAIHKLETLRNPVQRPGFSWFLSPAGSPERSNERQRRGADLSQRLVWLSSTASRLGRSTLCVLSTSTVEAAPRGGRRDRNDKQPRLWSQSQRRSLSSFTFSSLFCGWTLGISWNGSRKYPNMTEKSLNIFFERTWSDFKVQHNYFRWKISE